ncbi:hypothetical protein [Streptomyces sp. NPDC021622]|uniref:hypothetical protein n=1 Tax=Streptomyces sp. NPDC021622 TaxID=3155013 RepID=UPI0034005883
MGRYAPGSLVHEPTIRVGMMERITMGDNMAANVGDSAGGAAGVLQPAVSLAQEVIKVGAGGVVTNDMVGNAQEVVNTGLVSGAQGVGSGQVGRPSSMSSGTVLGQESNSGSGQDSGLL